MNVSFYLLHADDMQFSAIDLGDDRLGVGQFSSTPGISAMSMILRALV